MFENKVDDLLFENPACPGIRLVHIIVHRNIVPPILKNSDHIYNLNGWVGIQSDGLESGVPDNVQQWTRDP